MKIIIFYRDSNQWGFKHLLKSLNAKNNLFIIHINDLDEETVDFLSKNNIKYYKYQQPFLLDIFELFLSFFTKKPKSKNFDTLLKRNKLRNKSWKAIRNFYLYKLSPKFLSVDQVFKILSYFGKSHDNIINNINPDLILYPSRFVNKFSFLARAHKINYEIYPFIFSWDNPFKDSFLPTLFKKYYVWNEEMADDLNEIHNIDKSKCVSIGGFMFDYLKIEYKDVKLNEYQTKFLEIVEENKNNYYLYTCGIGYSPGLLQEIELCKEIYKRLKKLDPNSVFIVRPYPDQPKGVEPYLILKEMGIIVQEDIIAFNIQNDTTNYIKQRLLKNAKCVINAFTTMVFEAAYFNVPIIQFGFIPDDVIFSNKSEYSELDINVIFQNEHIQKYLIKKEYNNVVSNWEKFENFILDKLLSEKNYRLYLNSFSKLNEINHSISNLIKEI